MRVLVTLLALVCWAEMSQAEVVKYSNKAQWQSLVGAFTTITFTEVRYPALITTQYSYLGVIFTDGNDAIDDSSALINDGFGLDGNLPGNSITISFATPIASFAIDHPGFEGFKLYDGDSLVFDTGVMGGGGTGFFSGVISTMQFDKVVINDPLGHNTLIDDLHFGPPIPAPSALALLGMALVARSRRRRCPSCDTRGDDQKLVAN